jgi:hypothetical protein
VIYEEIADSIREGYFSEGDFDATGVLWFTYSGAGIPRTNAPSRSASMRSRLSALPLRRWCSVA